MDKLTTYTNVNHINKTNELVDEVNELDGNVVKTINGVSPANGNVTISVAVDSTTADKLKTPRNIGVSGGAVGTPVSFDGSKDVTINVTQLKAESLVGTASVNTTGNAATASSVDWENVKKKPATFTPSTHTHNVDEVTGLAVVAKTGKYTDLTSLPTIPSKVSQLANDSQYITADDKVNVAAKAENVEWSGVQNKPAAFIPAAHNQASSTINAMTGYTKATTVSAIAATDSLNAAIGKLEKALENKINTGATIAATSVTGLATVAKTGAYNDLSGKPTIPAKVSQLTNDSGYITSAGNAATATKLATARTISMTGAATAAGVAFNGTANIALNVTSLNAAKLTGTASINTTGKANTAGVADSAKACTGNAATATKAVQDGNGKTIATTYVPLSGGKMTGNLTVPKIITTTGIEIY